MTVKLGKSFESIAVSGEDDLSFRMIRLAPRRRYASEKHVPVSLGASSPSSASTGNTNSAFSLTFLIFFQSTFLVISDGNPVRTSVWIALGSVDLLSVCPGMGFETLISAFRSFSEAL